MSTVANERTKLTAGLLNTIVGFSLTAGAVAPLIAVSYGVIAALSLGAAALVFITAIWMAVGIGLHIYARRVLRRPEAMSAEQFIAIVVAPLCLLAVGYGLMRWSLHTDR